MSVKRYGWTYDPLSNNYIVMQDDNYHVIAADKASPYMFPDIMKGEEKQRKEREEKEQEKKVSEKWDKIIEDKHNVISEKMKAMVGDLDPSDVTLSKWVYLTQDICNKMHLTKEHDKLYKGRIPEYVKYLVAMSCKLHLTVYEVYEFIAVATGNKKRKKVERPNVLKMLELFDVQGHSATSGFITLDAYCSVMFSPDLIEEELDSDKEQVKECKHCSKAYGNEFIKPQVTGPQKGCYILVERDSVYSTWNLSTYMFPDWVHPQSIDKDRGVCMSKHSITHCPVCGRKLD